MDLKSGIWGVCFLLVAQGSFALSDSEVIRVIIKYKHNTFALSSLTTHISQITHLPVQAITPMANDAYSLILRSKTGQNKLIATQAVLNNLRADADILYAVKDRIGHFKPVPEPVINSEISGLLSHDAQWDEFARPAGVMLESRPGLRDGAWAYTSGKSHHQVVVAVLDTGTALNDSLVNNLIKDRDGRIFGWNFAGNNNELADETGSYHGTHVAGTIAGYGQVMSGMGEDLKILTVKIPDKNGMFYESAVINGIYWSVGAPVPGVPANHHPAKVLNMSFGVDIEPGREADYCDEALQEAVFYVRKQGAVIAAAAGNDDVWEHFNAPAVCNGTIKVASTGPKGLRSYFSNYGPGVTLAAPGGDKRYGIEGGILSTVNPGGGYHGSGFDFYQGTSMASPHVAGVAGLIFSVNDHLNAEQVEQILYMTTHDFGTSDDPNKSCIGKKPCGHGILDAEHALTTALNDYNLLIQAPTMAQLDTQPCGLNKRAPRKYKISLANTVWLSDQVSCQPEETYQHPHVEKDIDGSIYAYYGLVRYQLDQSKYRSCKVIGYDGVGCFN
ncbi:MAG: S8 family serine peptidase [bacterium]|nr:S8 family serine peptidase [bacterium]